MEEVTVLFSKNGFEKTEKVSINALVKGEETPETPEKPEGSKPEESKPEESKPEESKPDKGNNGLVQTGDISSLGATAAMLMASGATILVTRKRKEKNNILKT